MKKQPTCSAVLSQERTYWNNGHKVVHDETFTKYKCEIEEMFWIFHEPKCIKGKLLFFNLSLHAFLSIKFMVRENVDCCDVIKQSSYIAKLIYFNTLLATPQILTFIKNNIWRTLTLHHLGLSPDISVC